MLSSYDLTNFSKKLKSIRNSLGYSQSEVAERTGINSDTLRRLENGMSIPRFDTLEVLSLFYKENLILLLDSYKISSELSYFYDLIDYYMVNEDYVSLSKSISDFEMYITANTLQVVDNKEIEQLRLFFIGLELSFKEDEISKQNALSYLEESLKIGNPLFKLNSWNKYKFNFLELRTLFTIASIEGGKRNCDLSNDIIIYILNYLDPSPLSKFYEKMLIVKSLCIIAYNYHRLGNNELVLEYAERGYKFCIDNSILAYLHLLLFRKGTAMFHLRINGYEKYIEQAIQLLRIQNKHSVAENYSTFLSKYKSEFSSN